VAKKRNTLKGNRAALIARLTAVHQAAPSFDNPAPARIKLRVAEASDMVRVSKLCSLAGVDLESEVIEAVSDGSAGATFQAGMASGVEGFLAAAQRSLPDLYPDTLRRAFLGLTLVIVAEHRDAGVIGAALASPPIRTIMKLLRQMQTASLSATAVVPVVLAGALRVGRIKAVAVDDDFRHRGIGAALVQACITVFENLGHSIVYGMMPPTQDDLRFWPDRRENQVLHRARNTGAEAPPGEHRGAAGVTDLDELVPVVHQDAVEQLEQLVQLGRVGTHGRVQHLGEERQQLFVVVGQPEPGIVEDPVVVPVVVDAAVLHDVLQRGPEPRARAG
jgi:GNAT superfamily N-acetyltransferase